MTHHRLLVVAAFAVWAQCSAAWAQIVVSELTPLGLPIVATIDAADGSKVAWRADAGSSVVNAGLGRSYIWAVPGSHVIQAVVSPAGDAEIQWLEATYAVGDAPPVPPGPVVKTLAQLAGKDREALAGVYRKLLVDVEAGGYPDVPLFKATHDFLLADLKLSKNGAAAEIDKRLAVKTIDELKAALQQIVKELGDPAPDPGPDPSPAPIPVAGLHVLIIEETDDRGRVPPTVLGVLTTTQVQAEVKSKGGQFKQYDDDPDVAAEPWKTAMARPHATVPWIIVSNGAKGGFEGPLPATIAETLALIQKYE